MATSMRLRAPPSCMACMRRLLDLEIGPPMRPFFMQVRGKKKKVHSETIPVRLVSDIAGYGPAGATLRVKPGQMRNYWFPQGIADYITGEDLRHVKRNPGQVTERDQYFGKERPVAEQAEVQDEVVRIETQLLSPQRSEELLQTLLPDHIEFFRQPIAPADAKPQSPEREAPERVAQASPQAIYGSVSAEDIAANIREFLVLKAAEETNKDAGRVVLRAEDIVLLRDGATGGIEENRIKVLGEFEFDVQVKGASPVRRRLRVSAQV